MRRLLYQLFLINLAILLITVVAVFTARWMLDPETTPLGRAQLAVSLALDAEQPPEIIEARLEAMQHEFGGGASVFDLDGRLLASSLDPPLPLEPTATTNRYLIYDEHGEQTGWVVFGPIPRKVIGQAGRALLLAVVFAGVVGLGPGFWLTRRLVEPLERLTTATRAIGRGEFDVEVAIERDDELGALGRAFDEMTRRLALLQRSQRELLASVSHELRTPLARMRLAHAMLQEGEAVDELLPELDSDLGELERMVARVLDAARMDLDLSRGAPTVLGPREVIGVGELVERIAARYRLAHPERALDVSAEAELGSIEVDVAALLRACDNLLDNATRYGPADRPLRLEGRRLDGRVELAFADEGPGIPAELHELVFTPFFRADPSRSRETGGLGLGLTMVARIVEAHGGTVHVDSREGLGATFKIRLPMSA